MKKKSKVILSIVLVSLLVVIGCGIAIWIGVRSSRAQPNNPGNSAVCIHSEKGLSSTSVKWIKANVNNNVVCAHKLALDVESQEPAGEYVSITMSLNCGFKNGQDDTLNMSLMLNASDLEVEQITPDLVITFIAREDLPFTYRFENIKKATNVETVISYFVGCYELSDEEGYKLVDLSEEEVVLYSVTPVGDVSDDASDYEVKNELGRYYITKAVDLGLTGSVVNVSRNVEITAEDEYGVEQIFTLSGKINSGKTLYFGRDKVQSYKFTNGRIIDSE